MTTAVQHRRGTTTEHSTFTGLEGEVTIDTTKDTAIIHDGAQAGGYPLAKETLSNANPSSLAALDGASSASDDQFLVYDTSISQMKKMSRAELNNAITAEPFDTVDINGGTIDGTVIGGSSAAAGTFTSVNSTTNTASTSITTPLAIGGTSTTSALQLRSTSGVGTTGADIIFQTGNNGTTESMRVLNSGNVGIGTTSPSTKLDVNGNTNITGTLTASSNFSATNSWALIRGNSIAWPTSVVGQSAGRFALAASGGTATLVLHDDTLVAAGTGSGGVLFTGRSNDTGPAYAAFGRILATKANATQGNTTANMIFQVGGSLSERMRIDSSGSVGIGTSSPDALLTVNTIASFGDGAAATPSIAHKGDLNTGLWFPAADTIAVSTNGTEKMRIDSAGLVGIGTTPATNNLRVLNSVGVVGAARIIIYNNTSDGMYLVGGNSSYNAFSTGDIGIGSVGVLKFAANNAIRMQIDTSGNVLNIGPGGFGYGTGSGGAVTQTTSRTQGVTLDTTNGSITLISAAGTTTWQSVTVTNNKVAATDTIIVNQKSGTDLYQIFVTNVAAGSFKISFATTGGTTTEQPVFNFAVIKAVTA